MTNNFETLLNRFDKSAIEVCYAASSFSILCARVVGDMVRNPVMAATSLASRKVRAVFS